MTQNVGFGRLEEAEHRVIKCFNPKEKAGQWRKMKNLIRKFIILTATPNETVGRVHARMPLIVQPEHYHRWLEPDGLFQSVLNPPDKNELTWHPVNRALNGARNEGAELLMP
jgi:putative SOS response-associated peptidase YedK